MKKNLKVLAISGSTRKQSFNSSALRAAQKLAPQGMQIEIFDLKDIPFMNQDLEEDGGMPESVRIFKEKIKEADAILISTPEYGNMIPGYLKNALEWGSRHLDTPYSVWHNKPLAIMGASDGHWGTVRAQLQLMQAGVILGMKLSGEHRLAIPEAQNKFDQNGELIDEEVRNRMIKFLDNFKNWALNEIS